MTEEALRERILAIRHAIRYHRDQRGHDRCWLDDWKLYEEVLGVMPPRLPEFKQCITLCYQYHTARSTRTPQHLAGKPKSAPDKSLTKMKSSRLLYELTLLETAVSIHHKLGDGKRTAKDDQRLYAVLPDNISTDQRLPSKMEFMPRCDLHISAQFKKAGRNVVRD